MVLVLFHVCLSSVPTLPTSLRYVSCCQGLVCTNAWNQALESTFFVCSGQTLDTAAERDQDTMSQFVDVVAFGFECLLSFIVILSMFELVLSMPAMRV